MKTLNLGVELEQGADFSLVIGIFGINGPIDITGYSFVGEMKSSTDPDGRILAEFDFVILDQSTRMGQLQWSLPACKSNCLPLSISNSSQKTRLTTPFVFDIKMQDTLGFVSRIVQGIVYVSPQVTLEQIDAS